MHADGCLWGCRFNNKYSDGWSWGKAHCICWDVSDRCSITMIADLYRLHLTSLFFSLSVKLSLWHTLLWPTLKWVEWVEASLVSVSVRSEEQHTKSPWLSCTVFSQTYFVFASLFAPLIISTFSCSVRYMSTGIITDWLIIFLIYKVIMGSLLKGTISHKLLVRDTLQDLNFFLKRIHEDTCERM